MTEFEIIKELAKRIDERKFPFQMPNAFIYSWESDYWAMTANGVTREFEIKCCRSDYFNDAKKDKHKECNGANYFYYVCPKDLIKKNEVDKKYGLIYVFEDGGISIEKKPQRLNNNVFTQWQMLANKMYWKWRSLWRLKYINKEITHDEWAAGINDALLEEQPSQESDRDKEEVK